MPLSRRRLIFFTAAVAVRALLADGARADQPTKQECVVANESAQDLQRAGKLIEARQQLETCAAGACPAAVRTDCAERLQAVREALPTVVLIPKDPGGGDASTASLAIDGVVQSVVLDGKPVTVDPGPHTFTVTLAGRSPVSLRLTLADGDHVRRDVVFRAAPAAAEPAVEPPASSGEPSTRAVSAPRSEGNVVNMRRIGWASIGAGAAGLTLGTVFGFLATGKKVSLGNECHALTCPPSARADIDGLHFDAVAADISFAVGILGVGAGSALLLFFFPENAAAIDAPRQAAGGIAVRPWAGLGALGLRGSFR